MPSIRALLCLVLASCTLISGRRQRVEHQHVKRQTPGHITKHSITIPFDHFQNESRYEPHTNVTFENTYWLDISNYRPGGPVFVLALGEDGDFDLPWLQHGLVHQLANVTGGVAVMWGQRYYAGNYLPPGIDPNADFFHQYSSTNLRFHTTEQAIADLAYFATHASFPGLSDRNLTAPNTPWFIVGGSYAGVISAFTKATYPDLFWGGLSSSGVTNPIVDFWLAFEVAVEYGPPDCVKLQRKVANIFDNIMTSKNKAAITRFRNAIGASPDQTAYDLAVRLAVNWENFAGGWVKGEQYDFNGKGTYCANITSNELHYPQFTNASTRALAKQIIHDGGWSNETSELLYPIMNLFGLARYYPAIAGGNYANPFDYITCLENPMVIASYTPGDPGRPTVLPIVSRLLTVEPTLQSCRETYNLSSNWQPDLSYYESFGGVNLSYPRLMLSTGQKDELRPATPLAEHIAYNVPNPRAKSVGTISEPQIVIENGFHEYDLPSVFANQTTASYPPLAVQKAHAREIGIFQTWLQEWHEAHPSA